MNMRNLPSGPWESLFPKALELVDEIAKHGGIEDPFFTFGGGTVLMLRHNHRMSKDIDLFVPDPQSLGFVNPRLSDVAEDICNAQYAEAANFIKLHLSAGEIDFVASPNLLAPEQAYERWELFGRSVRVETAAEIVSKKMYHRGDRATGRDLFDLATVLKVEPGALVDAEPFMHRHVDAFLANLGNPSEYYQREFDAVQTLDFAPTFEQARASVTSYLNGLVQEREQSVHDISTFAHDNGLRVAPADTQRGEYCGPIVHRTSRHLLQDVGRGDAVMHDVKNVPVAASRLDHGAQPVKLRYAHGTADLIARPARERSRGG